MEKAQQKALSSFIWPCLPGQVDQPFPGSLWSETWRALLPASSVDFSGSSWHHDFHTERMSSKFLSLIFFFQVYNIFEVYLRFPHFEKIHYPSFPYFVSQLFIQRTQLRHCFWLFRGYKAESHDFQGWEWRILVITLLGAPGTCNSTPLYHMFVSFSIFELISHSLGHYSIQMSPFPSKHQPFSRVLLLLIEAPILLFHGLRLSYIWFWIPLFLCWLPAAALISFLFLFLLKVLLPSKAANGSF